MSKKQVIGSSTYSPSSMISSKQPVVPFQSLNKFNALLRVGNFIFIKNVPDKTCENCVQFKVLLNKHIFESHSSMTRCKHFRTTNTFLTTLHTSTGEILRQQFQTSISISAASYLERSSLDIREGGRVNCGVMSLKPGGRRGMGELQLGVCLNKSCFQETLFKTIAFDLIL